ncbi:MAG TPA: hypothetical protein VGM76_16995 [Lacipirellulaceae bacterium]|jgi:hypothetical protein
MLTRLIHSIVTLVAIIVAYELYVLAVVPWLEPPLAVRAKQNVTDSDWDVGAHAITKYQRILSAYFPANHWSQQRTPKVIESGNVMLVLDDYVRHDDNRVDMSHFALVMFPTPRDQGVAPPRDAIILEAPQGAHLQFDENFHPERGQLGQILHGIFPGPITIRSDMKNPGPEDDLLVETSDVEMNQKLLVSPNEVRFRLGPNIGSGRELEIRLLKDEQSESRSGGLKIAGIETMEIRREVKLRVFLGASSLLPGDKPDHKSADRQAINEHRVLRRLPFAGDTQVVSVSNIRLTSAEVDVAPAEQAFPPVKPPVDVTCSGPFHFDFQTYIASFDRDVEVVQLNPSGPSDQLTCQQLDIHFAPKLVDGAPQPAVDTTREQQKDLGRLTAQTVIAQGYPVVVVSPSRFAEARGGRVELQLLNRKVIISGGQDVSLTQGPNVLRAPTIIYQQPDRDATTKLGTFHADGPGTLHYIPDLKKPDQVFEAAWKASVDLGRNSGQPVLTLAGRPQLLMSGMGELTADQVIVYLRELEVAAEATPAAPDATPHKVHVVPDRLNAVGQVEVDSPQLLARTRELKAQFHVETPPEVPANASAGTNNGAPASNAGANNPAALNFASRDGSPASPPGQTHQIAADEIQLQIAIRGSKASPTNLLCNGHVAFREVPKPGATEEPLDVRGGQLVADQLDTAPRMVIHGAAPNQPPGSQLTEIKARGMTMRAADVNIDKGQNRMWVDGPGEAIVVPTHDVAGKAAVAPTPYDIHWQGSLNFDGRHVVLQKNITVVGTDDHVSCDQLTGTLTSPVLFGQRTDSQKPDMAEVECRGNVKIDHVARDTVGLTSHERGQLARLTFNQQTGRITGDGPGTLRSTAFGGQSNPMASPPTGGKVAAANRSQLHFLRIDFQQGLAGNLTTKEIAFHERVHTIYGPVDAWEQELDPNHPETLPPDTLTVTSDDLSVNEDPVAARAAAGKQESGMGKMGPTQMRATGSVQIDGQSPTQGVFSANAASAAYEQIKEMFILEGTDRQPATLRHQTGVGGKQITDTARKIQYNQRTGQVQQDGVHLFEFTPGDAPAAPHSAQGPAPRHQ